MKGTKKYRFSSLASRVRAGINFLDSRLPVGVWYSGITEDDLKRLDMNSSTNDILSIIFCTTFPDATFNLGICIGEVDILGFNPHNRNPIESWKLDRLWRHAVKICQKRTLKFYGLKE